MTPTTQTKRTRRFRRRLSVRLIGGVLLGAALLFGIGFIVGSLAFRTSVAWGIAIGTAVFGGVAGALIGGMSSLESPDPGLEPSQFEHPVSDPEGLTREERDSHLPDRGAPEC